MGADQIMNDSMCLEENKWNSTLKPKISYACYKSSILYLKLSISTFGLINGGSFQAPTTALGFNEAGVVAGMFGWYPVGAPAGALDVCCRCG